MYINNYDVSKRRICLFRKYSLDMSPLPIKSPIQGIGNKTSCLMRISAAYKTEHPTKQISSVLPSLICLSIARLTGIDYSK